MTYRYGGRSPEYHPIAKVGSGMVILGLLVSSCVRETQATAPPPEAYPTLTPTQEIFTPTPDFGQIVEGIAPSRNEILVAYGEAVGAGGPVTSLAFEKVYNSSFLQRELNNRGLAPYLDSENGISQIGYLQNGPRLCFPNMPPQLYNPNVASGRDDRLFDSQFVISYGDGLTGDVRYQAISAVSLERAADEVICVSAVVNRADNPYRAAPGTLFNVLMNKDTGYVYGEFPAVYGASDRVEVRADPETGNLHVVVNGSLRWYTGEGMLELKKRVTPTPDPVEIGMGLAGVVRVEQHEGLWVGFDRDGYPIWESTDSTGTEWERFERDLGLVCKSGREGRDCDLLTPELLRPIDDSQVKPIQFTNEYGQIIKVEDGRFPALDAQGYPTYAVAGVIRGILPIPLSVGGDSRALYIEVRLNEFESQGLFYLIPDQSEFLPFVKVLDQEMSSGGVSYDHAMMSPRDVLELIMANESAWINQQIIFRIQAGSDSYDEQRLRDHALLMEAIENREAINIEFFLQQAELFLHR
jgi:hypothetical protein